MPDPATVYEVRDPDAWDAFVAAHPHGSFLQAWRWGELKASYGWRPLRLAIGANGAIDAGLQMLLRTRRLSPLGPRAGVAYLPRGPLTGHAAQATALLQAALRHARAAGASFLRAEPPEATLVEPLRKLRFRASAQFVQIPRTGIVDLTPELDVVLAGFKSKMRYNIRLATRRGVEIVEATGEGELRAFYELTQTTARRERFSVHALSYYRDVWQTFRPDHGALFIASHEGEPLAALLTLRFGPTAVYLYGASSDRRRNLMAAHAIQWAAMRWAKAHGCQSYDLWGMADPADPDDPMAGVHRFKLGFNPRIVEFPGAFDRSLQSLRAWALTDGVLRARRLVNRWRNRPAAAFNA